MADGAQTTVRDRVTLEPKKMGYFIKCQFLVADIVQDAILGLPWMKELNPRLGQLKFRAAMVEYRWHAERSTQIENSFGSQLVDLAGLEEFCQEVVATELFFISGGSESPQAGRTESSDPRTQALLQRYSDVFEEPLEPPPSRPEDHRILL